MILHTDGSGVGGRIGAAVVVDIEDHRTHSQMGDEDTSTVYAAELCAIEMALTLLPEKHGIVSARAENGLAIFADKRH